MSKLQLENSILNSLEIMLTINYANPKVVQNDNTNESEPAEESGRGVSLINTLNSQYFRE